MRLMAGDSPFFALLAFNHVSIWVVWELTNTVPASPTPSTPHMMYKDCLSGTIRVLLLKSRKRATKSFLDRWGVHWDPVRSELLCHRLQGHKLHDGQAW